MKLVLKDSNLIATHMDNQTISLEQYPSADKICFAPDNIQIIFNEETLQTPDPRINLDEETLRECVRTDINNVTDDLFLTTTITYGGIEFPIKKENQFDYKAVVDEARAGFLEYPYMIKGSGSTYYNIANLDDANAFYLSGMTAIQTILRTGWALKDSLSGMTMQELLDFSDPRL